MVVSFFSVFLLLIFFSFFHQLSLLPLYLNGPSVAFSPSPLIFPPFRSLSPFFLINGPRYPRLLTIKSQQFYPPPVHSLSFDAYLQENVFLFVGRSCAQTPRPPLLLPSSPQKSPPPLLREVPNFRLRPTDPFSCLLLHFLSSWSQAPPQ